MTSSLANPPYVGYGGGFPTLRLGFPGYFPYGLCTTYLDGKGAVTPPLRIPDRPIAQAVSLPQSPWVLERHSLKESLTLYSCEVFTQPQKQQSRCSISGWNALTSVIKVLLYRIYRLPCSPCQNQRVRASQGIRRLCGILIVAFK